MHAPAYNGVLPTSASVFFLWVQATTKVLDFLTDCQLIHEFRLDGGWSNHFFCMSLFFMILSLAASAYIIIYVLPAMGRLQPELYKDIGSKTAFGYIMLISCTDMKLLNLLPWNHRDSQYLGFPDFTTLALTFAAWIFEHFPQLAIQFYIALNPAPSYNVDISISVTTFSLLLDLIVFGITHSFSRYNTAHRQRYSVDCSCLTYVPTSPPPHTADDDHDSCNQPRNPMHGGALASGVEVNGALNFA
jgi:hypothetical protein